MRISDWSSDVCSSDLAGAEERARAVDGLRAELVALRNERDGARTELATLKADARAFEARLTELKEAKDVMASQFAEVANKLLGEAPKSFLERAQQRFTQAGESNRSEERRVGKECVRTCRSRLSRYP